MSDTVYGPFLGPRPVKKAARATLQRYVNDYLGAVERWDGRTVGSISRPNGWTFKNEEDFSAYEGNGMLPAILVICPGLVDDPVRYRSGWKARWFLGVAIVCGGQSDDEEDVDALTIAELYGAAVRTLILQHGGLGTSWVTSTEYVDERYDRLGEADSSTLKAGRLVFTVETFSVPSPTLVPHEDDITPPGGTPPDEDPEPRQVTSTHTEIKKVSTTTEVDVS